MGWLESPHQSFNKIDALPLPRSEFKNLYFIPSLLSFLPAPFAAVETGSYNSWSGLRVQGGNVSPWEEKNCF